MSVKTNGLDRFYVIDGVESCLDNLSLGCDDILATENARLNLLARSRPGVDLFGTPPHQEHSLVKRSLTLTAIVSIIFFNVSGGPYGLESVLKDGPGLAMLLILMMLASAPRSSAITCGTSSMFSTRNR